MSRRIHNEHSSKARSLKALAIEQLEARDVPAIFTVGPGDENLRSVFADAATNADADNTIQLSADFAHRGDRTTGELHRWLSRRDAKTLTIVRAGPDDTIFSPVSPIKSSIFEFSGELVNHPESFKSDGHGTTASATWLPVVES